MTAGKRSKIRFRGRSQAMPASAHTSLTVSSVARLANPDPWYGRTWWTRWGLRPALRKRSIQRLPTTLRS